MNVMSVEKNGGIKFLAGGKREKPRKKPTQTQLHPPRNPLGVTETRNRDPSDGTRTSNRLRHGAALTFDISIKFCKTSGT